MNATTTTRTPHDLPPSLAALDPEKFYIPRGPYLNFDHIEDATAGDAIMTGDWINQGNTSWVEVKAVRYIDVDTPRGVDRVELSWHGTTMCTSTEMQVTSPLRVIRKANALRD